ncbi:MULTISPECIES: site-specific DNA-methyltransferase [unclassified Mesorhizobium]|uniref:site-specific DNA-methyltransferase n=1 Tax=unclassified Mesorhizobium TaxID=325217 RepID=UPI001093764D|nr:MULTISPECIES: site-specific DNA-methyltransferase [unclassified Mesorhizobium]TGT90902.1 site-specific DNA-methyltransferase [Mesorhizobium sp. M8A.F.Ca.ET.161.01.1.1]TGV43818.1 site-specific DNA-methyltransferase [Mesorhizobium sp. M8A.F.Ca.ET.142.01.1.1]
MGGRVTLHAGDNRVSLRRLIDQGVRVHSVVCDPPYALTSITKRFGKKGSACARTEGNDGSFARLSGGFMGKIWDATGIERDPEFWKLVYEILLPGGYVFAFSGARTGHWQACAMEIAGFIMHPMHGWVYGQGWPKPTYIKGVPEWEGWGYGTQSQKPALEPIYLGQRPFSTKTAMPSILKHGVGAFNIKGCTVGDGSESISRDGEAAMDRRYNESGATDFAALPGAARGGSPEGRGPANLILDGSPSVVDLFPVTRSGKPGVMRKGRNDGATYGAESRAPGTAMTGYGDEGSNARFFHQFAPTEEDYQWAIDAGRISDDRGDAIIYNAKANKADRAASKHPTVKPIALLQYLIRHITPAGGVVLDMFAGSGTTAEAAKREGFDCILMEAEPEYLEFLHTRFHFASDTDIGINALAQKGATDENFINADLCLIDILGENVLSTRDGFEPVAQPGSLDFAGHDLTALLY